MSMRHTRIIQDKQGGVAILTAIAIVLLILTMGVAIETGRAFLLRNKAVNALDGAVLAAASVATTRADPNEINQRAKDFFAANFPANYLGAIVPPVNVVYNSENRSLTSDLSMRLPLYFGAFLPIDEMQIDIFSQTSRVVRSAEIALVLDHTGSLCFPNCEPREKIIDAVETLFTTLRSLPRPEDLNDPRLPQYSYIPFNHSVNVNGVPQYPASNPNYNAAVQLLPDAIGLTPDARRILDVMIDNKVQRDAQGGTNTSIGTWWGWRSLRTQDADKNRFVGDSAHYDPDVHPAPFPYETGYDPNDPTFKFMIILTDGNNEFFLNGNSRVDKVANFDQRVFCDGIKQQGITIFTIAFGVDAPANRLDDINAILQECATDPSFAYRPARGEDLREIFEDIADRISSLVITE